MKIWSSGRRSDEQQVIIRTKTLFVDVILAFSTSKNALALPWKLYTHIFVYTPKFLPFFLISARRGSVHRGSERINRDFIFYLWLYFFSGVLTQYYWESAIECSWGCFFYGAKTVIVLKVSFKIDERYQKNPLETRGAENIVVDVVALFEQLAASEKFLIEITIVKFKKSIAISPFTFIAHFYSVAIITIQLSSCFLSLG